MEETECELGTGRNKECVDGVPVLCNTSDAY